VAGVRQGVTEVRLGEFPGAPVAMTTMLAFFGPSQAVSIGPFCDVKDMAACAACHRSMSTILKSDSVWRHMLICHWRTTFDCLASLQADPISAEVIVSRLADAALREVFVSLRKALSSPFVLEPRARLLLEIHELLEWDRHLKRFLLHRTAAVLAEAINDSEVLERVRAEMALPALELVSLQAMMGDGRASLPHLEEDVRWSVSAESELRLLMDKRLQQRRTWWQRQREYLLQEAEWQ